MTARPRLLRATVLAVLVAPVGSGAAGDLPDSGGETYAAHCSICHGSALSGGGAPPLAGPTFLARWTGRKRDEFATLVAETMPGNAAGKLTPGQYRAVDDFILAANGFRPGAAILEADPAAGAAHPEPEPVLPAAPRVFGRSSGTAPDDADLATAAPGDWLAYNRDYRGQRFSPLTGITPANVGRLAPVCLFQTGDTGSFEASPVEYAGRLYVTTAHGTFAIDAATCRKIWEYDYVPPGAEGLPVNRGVALYRGKVLRGTPDGHVIALDAATGALLWDVWMANSLHGTNINGAPVAFDGKIYIGEGGADRGATGHVYALDVETGRIVWRFDPIPTGDQPGAETWKAGTALGGGSSWSTITVDPAHRLLYVPIGNPGADMDGAARPGDNLYTNSVVVLNAGDGTLAWYVQQQPHDTHDWDTAAAPTIYDMGDRRFMAVASKDGWLYLYDLATRALIARSELDSHVNADVAMIPGQALRVCPGTLGGAEWNGPALDPGRGLLFVNAVDWCGTFKPETAPGSTFGGALQWDPFDQASGWLRAFDAATGAERWARRFGGPMVAGVTPTASGLVFTGLPSGEFLALDSATGRTLYEFNTGGAIAGGISTYDVAGRQFVAVTSGSASKTIWHAAGSPTLVVFGLTPQR
jgi:PQQ-dependent dehydrogenase (methanol/ethanol family)